jgi:hypothetical protein
MNSANPVEVGRDLSSIGSVLSRWYALNSDITRLWVYEPGSPDHDAARDIHVVVAIRPVGDSDDIGPIWLARCTGWHDDLQRLIGRPVHLDWFEADTEAVPCVEDLDHDGTCIASIAWRDPSIGLAENTGGSLQARV